MFMMIALSVVAFFIIELPPGDFVTTYVAKIEAKTNMNYTEAEVEVMRKAYGLDKPAALRYFYWVGKIVRGQLGRSFLWDKPVAQLIAERLPYSLIISFLSLLAVYMASIPIGIYSATHQYSIGDYFFSIIGFMGLAIPNFAMAIILMYIFYKYFGLSVGGLFASEYIFQPWNINKFLNMLVHLPIPIIVVGTAGMAGVIRVMRGSLLDELPKQYVVTARAKGVPERRLLIKYPVRVALNPIISTIGWMLPFLISGEIITSIVLSVPTIGPLLLSALQGQDSYLAGSIILILGALTVIGTFISDILLVVVDPRIRLEKEGAIN